MAIDPKQKLKNLIDELSEQDAQDLLDELSFPNQNFSSLDDVQTEYENVKNQFKDAFQELA
jgi:hypothetical protein